MSSLPLSLVIEGLVAALLLVTIGYCVVLNGRLKRLRADEAGLRATIAELLTATEIAERAIHGLKTASAQCDHTLGQRLGEARQVSQELATNMDGAGALVERVGKLANVSGGLGGRLAAAANDQKTPQRTRSARTAGQSATAPARDVLREPVPVRGRRDAGEASAVRQRANPGPVTSPARAAVQDRLTQDKPAKDRPTPASRSLDDAARYLQARLQRVAS